MESLGFLACLRMCADVRRVCRYQLNKFVHSIQGVMFEIFCVYFADFVFGRALDPRLHGHWIRSGGLSFITHAGALNEPGKIGGFMLAAAFASTAAARF